MPPSGTIAVFESREDTAMKKQPRTLTEGHIRRYALYLQEQERSAATIRK